MRAQLYALLFLVPLVHACKSSEEPPTTDPLVDERVLRPRSQPIEFVGLTVKKRVDVAGFEALVGPIFGEAARAGRGHKDFELQPGLFLTVDADPRTAEQVIVRLDMVPPNMSERRTVLNSIARAWSCAPWTATATPAIPTAPSATSAPSATFDRASLRPTRVAAPTGRATTGL